MGYIASLSTGENFPERPNIPGERSSWQTLLQRLRDTGNKMTGLELHYPGIVISAMSAKMCDGYFQAYEATRTLWRDTASLKQGIGSVIGDRVFITWITLDANTTGINHITQEIRPLKEVLIHTTLA